MLRKLNATGPNIYRWKIRLRLSGVQIHKHITATPAVAQQIYADLLAQKARGQLGLSVASANTDTRTLYAAIADYEVEKRANGENEQHIADVCHSLRLLVDVCGDIPLRQVTREHMTAWKTRRQALVYHGKPATARTVNKAITHVAAFWNWCDQWIDASPMSGIKKVKEVAPPIQLLMFKDFCTFANAAWKRPRFGLLVELLGETGARVDNIISAKCGDVDGQHKLWHKVVKPGRRIAQDAGPWMLKIAKGRPADAPLCPAEDGKPWTYAMVKKAFAHTLAGLPVKRFTPHAIRHGRACWDLIEGRDIYAVKTKLDHASVKTTERYVRAAEILQRLEKGKVRHRRPVKFVPPVSHRHGRQRTQPDVNGRLPIKRKWDWRKGLKRKSNSTKG
jgi:integrase